MLAVAVGAAAGLASSSDATMALLPTRAQVPAAGSCSCDAIDEDARIVFYNRVPKTGSTTMLTFLYLIIYAVNEGSHVYVACVQHDVFLGLGRLLAGVIYIYIISAMWYVAVMVSDPTGNDTCDFDLAFDLRQHVRYAMSAM